MCRQYQEYKITLLKVQTEVIEQNIYLLDDETFVDLWKCHPKINNFCLFYIGNFAYFNLFLFIRPREKK